MDTHDTQFSEKHFKFIIKTFRICHFVLVV